MQNLERETLLPGSKIIFSGDIMLDSIKHYVSKPHPTDLTIRKISEAGTFALATIHRESNVKSLNGLRQIVDALNVINKKVRVVMPVHPRTRIALLSTGMPIDFTLLQPVGYIAMLQLLHLCDIVLTDSGGLQKEAFFCKKMCVTIRNETEWLELVDSGVNILAGVTTKGILLSFERAQLSEVSFDHNFYGEGNAAEIITEEMLKYGTNF